MDHHFIYLLHIWTEKREGKKRPSLTRAALEEPHTGQKWGFKDMEGLVKFIEEVLVKQEERSV